MRSMAWSVPQRPSLVVIAVVVGTAGCGGHGDELERATQCLRDNHAHPHAAPPLVSHSFRESGWRTRTVSIDSNGLVIVATGNDAAARQARRRLAQAVNTADASNPPPHQRGSLVYVWDDPPSASDRAVVSRCLG
jgi:hypothetical protein